MSLLTAAAATALFFVVADIVYTLDHYFVHHDRERYRVGHARHHRRYNVAKNAPQLDDYELSTYTSAAIVSFAGMSTLSLLTGNWGFVIAAFVKYIHSLLFHCYQHHWWSHVPIRKQGLEPPTRGWGLASARYHAHHHAHPEDSKIFTYAESWQGFDRILEWAHPWLVRFTVDGRARSDATKSLGPTSASTSTQALIAAAAARKGVAARRGVEGGDGRSAVMRSTSS